jgi:hypothetical protein
MELKEAFNYLKEFRGDELFFNYTLKNGLTVVINFTKIRKPVDNSIYTFKLFHDRRCSECFDLEYVLRTTYTCTSIETPFKWMKNVLDDLNEGELLFLNDTTIRKNEYYAKLAMYRLFDPTKLDNCWICLEPCLPYENMKNLFMTENGCEHKIHSVCFRLYRQKIFSKDDDDDIYCGICKKDMTLYNCCN